jgi:hypothetical protein
VALPAAAHGHHLGKATDHAHPTVELHLTAELRLTAEVWAEDAHQRGTAEPGLPTTRARAAVASTPSHQALALQHGAPLQAAVDAHLLGPAVAHLPTRPTMHPPPAATIQHLRLARIRLRPPPALQVRLRLRAGQIMRLLRVH